MLSEAEYQTLYTESIDNPKEYWTKAANNVDWFKKWDDVCDLSDPKIPKWFRGAEVNVCYNCLDRHVARGLAEKVILHHRSSLTKKDRNLTYGYLLTEVSKLAAVLANCGVKKGDVVVIYMPNIPEGVMAMLACARLGAVHSVLFGGLTPTDLALRLEHSEAKVVVASVVGMFRNELLNYKERLDAAILFSKRKPEKCIFFRGDQKKVDVKKERDLIWEEVIDKFGTHDCVSVDSQHPMFYAYTSGTTGNPKAVVVECGPSLVRYCSEAKFWGLIDGKVALASSELGWILGHGLYCYFPLLNNFGSVILEGDLTAECDTMYKLVRDFKVNMYIGSYSTIRGIKSKDPDCKIAAEHDLSSMERLMVGAECPDKNSMEFAAKAFGTPILNMWGQTESNMGLATYFSTEQMKEQQILLYPRPSFGIILTILRDDGTEAAIGEVGRVLVKLPTLPGFAVTLLKRHEYFLQDYFQPFPGYYDTKDEGMLHEDGGINVIGRSDDVINVGPYRVAGSNVEEVILQHPEVIECVAVGVPDDMKGEVPLGLFICRTDNDIAVARITKEVNNLVLQKLGESIFFRGSICVQQLPKTMTGKIQRKLIRELLHGKALTESSGQTHSVLSDILRIVRASGIVSA